MFKSYFPSGWFRKAADAPPATTTDSSSFTMPGRDNSLLLKVSMKESTEEFVAIDYKKMSYAEVAQMSKNKKQTSKVPLAVPKSHRINENQYEILANEDEDLTESLYTEKVKTNNYFFKNKVYKDADRTRKSRRKTKN
ncbi:CIC11C00000004763 [Sungouiella intermedia]|uniref:CIC11C00000001147 n=1 Tax=Sungouiella intermedia TaxID=45354 RepID=A0A1L0DMK3_9ASCO|nr:CIC11C00000001147 [[Candida] intermedia]SGZ57312.1 CIC11C00000004763 [[Candida] intermedia]